MDDLEERLVLSLRTCASHNAGPVAAIAAIAREVEDGHLTREQARAVLRRAGERIEAMTALAGYRRDVVATFLRFVGGVT